MKYNTIIAVVCLMIPLSAQAWPWSPKPIDRPLKAGTQQELVKSVEELKNDLRPENYDVLITSLAWLTFYEGAIVGAGGTYNPDLALVRVCARVNGQKTKEILADAERLIEQAPKIFIAYKAAGGRW